MNKHPYLIMTSAGDRPMHGTEDEVKAEVQRWVSHGYFPNELIIVLKQPDRGLE